MERKEVVTRRIFISHEHTDRLTAIVVKDVLARAGVGRTFLDADDIKPGDDWQSKIRAALNECDAVITVLTPEFSKKPWMAAEWACFWAAEKTTYVLTLGVSVAKVFTPMTSAQVADLGSVSSMTSFLDAVAPGNEDNFTLATTLVERVARARIEDRKKKSESMFDDLLHREGVVHDSFIRALIEDGQIERLLALGSSVEGTNLTRPRLFKVAKVLYEEGVTSKKLIPLTLSIGHSNYQRDMVIAVLQSRVETDEDKRNFADSQFESLSTVAKNRVVTAADTLGFTLGSRWKAVAPFSE